MSKIIFSAPSNYWFCIELFIMQETILEKCFQNVVYMAVSCVNFDARHDYYFVYFTTSHLFLPQIRILWLVWLSGFSPSLWTRGSLDQFPVGAHAWVVGWVPSGGCMGGNHTWMFLFLSFSFSSPLSKNK